MSTTSTFFTENDMSTKNLHQRLVAIMEHMGAVGKGGRTSYGERYAYHRIDDIDDQLRQALVAHGVVATITSIDDRKLDHFDGVDRDGKPRTTWYTECVVNIELVNADEPTDRTTIQGWGQGLDYSDKATGKAISYAAKAAYLSAFHLRGQPDNEQDDIRRGHRAPARNSRPAPKPKTPLITHEEEEYINSTLKVIAVGDNEDLDNIANDLKTGNY